MWRHITKNFKQGLTKRLCIENEEPLLKDEGTSHCCINKLIPRSLQNINLYITNSKDGNQHKRANEDPQSHNVGNHTFLEAFGWSGALVFGWVISKQWWIKQTWSRESNTFGNNNSGTYNQRLIDLLTHVVKTQPPVNYILPKLEPPQSIKEKDDKYVLEEAANKLRQLHDKAIGESLNRRGIDYLSKSASEAIKYFSKAAEFKYPPASFNMGQCCELGIGTEQDFKKAAKWYKTASEQGHATAMYNLGVFYVHGWGGLKADAMTAKQLFTKAAELGQPDAKLALDKQSKSVVINSKMPIENVNKKSLSLQSFGFDLFVDKLKSELTDNIFKKEEDIDSWKLPIIRW